jgi:hypothetical protein
VSAAGAAAMASAALGSSAGGTTDWDTGFFSGPSAIITAAGQANVIVTTISSALDASTSTTIDEATRDAWDLFKLNWLAWYASHITGQNVTEEWFTEDLAGELTYYENRITTWGQELQSKGLVIPGGVPSPPKNNLGLPTGGQIIGVGLVLLTIIIAWKAL